MRQNALLTAFVSLSDTTSPPLPSMMSEKAPRPWLIASGSYRSRLRAHRESAGGRTRPQRRIPARRLAPAPPARRGSFAAREDGDLEAVDACAARRCQQRSPAHAFMEPCRRYCARARGRDGESPPAGERTASFRVPPLRAPPAADRDTSQPVRWAPEGSSRSCRLLVTVGPPERCNGGVPGRLGTPAPRPPRDAVPGRHFAQVSLVLLFYLCFSLLAWSACCWSALGLSSLWSAPAPLPSTSSATTRMSRPRPHFPSVLLTPLHLSPLTFFFRLSHPTACLVRPLLLLRSPLSTPTTRLRPDSLTSPLSPAPQTSACSRIRIRPLDASPLGWQRPRRRPRPRRWQRPHRRPRPRRWRLPLRRPSP